MLFSSPYFTLCDLSGLCAFALESSAAWLALRRGDGPLVSS